MTSPKKRVDTVADVTAKIYQTFGSTDAVPEQPSEKSCMGNRYDGKAGAQNGKYKKKTISISY